MDALRSLPLSLLLAAGCAAVGSASAPPADAPLAPDGCPAAETGLDPVEEFAEAERLIAEAGEHPFDTQLAEILPRLHRAALAGHLPAQRRFGYYVVGYFLTDEMFWPADRPTAISALAMLRIAVRRGVPGEDSWDGLGRDPVVLGDEPLTVLPAEWVAAAVAEAAEWERCHPGVSPAPGDWSAAGWRRAGEPKAIDDPASSLGGEAPSGRAGAVTSRFDPKLRHTSFAVDRTYRRRLRAGPRQPGKSRARDETIPVPVAAGPPLDDPREGATGLGHGAHRRGSLAPGCQVAAFRATAPGSTRARKRRRFRAEANGGRLPGLSCRD